MVSPELKQSSYSSSADAQPRTTETDPVSSQHEDLADAWAEIVARGNELREYAGYYIAANVDRLRLSFRTALVWTILGVVLAFMAVTIVVAGSALAVVGLANGAGELMGGRMWAGQLLVGTVILAAASGGVWFATHRMLERYRRALEVKYELRKEQERAQYGTDVEQRAQARPESV